MHILQNFVKSIAASVSKYFGKKIIKVGLSPSKNVFLIYFNESSLKLMENAFYFMFRTLFVLEIFTFLS